MWKIIIPITFLLILWLIVYYYGNKFVDEIQEEEEDKKEIEIKTRTKKSNPQVESFLASLSSNESFKEKLFQCDNYCHVCVLLERSINKVPFIKQALFEGISTLFTAIFIYYSSYLNNKKSEDFPSVLLYTLIFIFNVVIHFMMILKDFENFQNSSESILCIFEKKKINSKSE